jgi:hypothetical protein
MHMHMLPILLRSIFTECCRFVVKVRREADQMLETIQGEHLDFKYFAQFRPG